MMKAKVTCDPKGSPSEIHLVVIYKSQLDDFPASLIKVL